MLQPPDFTVSRTIAVLAAVAVLACLDLTARSQRRRSHVLFGAVLGTALAIALIRIGQSIFATGSGSSFTVTFAVLIITVLWRMLFGTWGATTKATVLGTFVFWLVVLILSGHTPEQRLAHLIAIGVAVLPVLVWCALFLPYHRERLSVVLAMLFAGMLSTVPILFYDALARAHLSLNFFVISVTPIGFSDSSHSFVLQYWTDGPPLHVSIFASLVSFFVVSFLEEGSKGWLLNRVGGSLSTSVNEVMELGVLVAIGFAFAENITPSGYFVSFVNQYLLSPTPDFASFIGNVLGRSILTTMVHITATGVFGYFLGIAIFASPILREERSRGRRFLVLQYLHRLLGLPEASVFRRELILIGFVASVVLHTFSNFIVTLPELLPGQPRTLGALFDMPPGHFLHGVALLLLPTLLYVVGGFWLITSLLRRQQAMKVRGHLVSVDTYITRDEVRDLKKS